MSLNLGEVLRGDRIMTSDYDLAMGQDKECQFLCSHVTDRKGVKRAQQLIEDGYVAEWIVDNLPGATSYVTVDKSHKYYAAGFKMGYKDISPVTGKPRYFINNHVTLVIRWRKAPGRAGDDGGKVIVGFEVYTKSVEAGHRDGTGCPQDIHGEIEGMEIYIGQNATNLANKYPHSSYIPEEDDVDDGSTLTIPYSYSVYFREDDRIDWSRRWDMYFNNQKESTSIHWLAIGNSLVICGLLTAVVVMVLNRTFSGDGKGRPKEEEGKVNLKRRTKTGNRSPRLREKGLGLLEQKGEADNEGDISSDDEFVEDITGWKLLHGDVFRAPPYAGFLAPLIGSGMQLVFMATGLLVLSCLGVLNPSFRGGFVSVGMGLFVFAGTFSGYFSGRVYKTFGGMNWRKNTLMVRSPFSVIPDLSTNGCKDRSSLPRPPLRHNVHPQPLRLGPSVQHRPPLRYPDRPPRPLAFHPTTPCLRRQLVWFPPQPAIRAPHKNQQHTPPDPHAIVVHQEHLQCVACGPCTLCCHLH